MDRLKSSEPASFAKCFVGAEPIAMKAGDTRVLVNGAPLEHDFRIVSEGNYQRTMEVVAAAGVKINELAVNVADLKKDGDPEFLRRVASDMRHARNLRGAMELERIAGRARSGCRWYIRTDRPSRSVEQKRLISAVGGRGFEPLAFSV